MYLTIRSKVLLLSLTFFSIPYVGYEYVLEMEKYLRDSLETSLKDTARALANVLHNQPELFDRQLPELIEYYTPIAELRNFRTPFRLDGNTTDWQDYWDDLRTFDYKYSLSSQSNWPRDDFYFQYLAGTYRNYLYSLFIVNDSNIVYRNPGDLALNNSDNLQIMLQDVDGYVHRYVVAPSAAGWVNAYRVSPGSSLLSDSERRIQGVWAETETGYIIEIRIPLNISGERFAFVINDVNNASIATVGIRQDDNTGDIYLNSAKIAHLIHGLGNAPGRRVWVLDKYQRVMALHGDLYRELPEHPLNELFTMLLPPVSETLGESQRGDGLYHTQVKYALTGKSDVRWHSSQDEKTVIVSAVYPVMAANNVIGAVMVEETNLSIQTVQRQAIANLFNKTLILFTVTTLLLLVFASRLSIRLRRLRNAAETAIDVNGRVTVTKIGSDAKDEIGDLSRSFSNILQKLHQYNRYLEGMASRLSHELRTPIAVVRSSLENLEHNLSPESGIYIERAKQGIERLNTTITRLSEATRLEQALQHAERERLDLKELLNNCIAGYRLAYPDRSFQAILPNEKAIAYVAPDLIAQMLDKLVSNAHDFAEADTAIRIELVSEKNMLRLSILNRGISIPQDMRTHLFNSMVSLRQTTDAKEPHLGLGLYMVRLIASYHGGQAKALDHPEGDGAMFSVWLPRTEI